MKAVTVDGVELVALQTRPDWFPIADYADPRNFLCRGCYFDSSDTMRMVDEKQLPGKTVNPTLWSCEKPHRVDERFYIPKDYYERHKPK